jgi:hypothetical protein
VRIADCGVRNGERPEAKSGRERTHLGMGDNSVTDHLLNWLVLGVGALESRRGGASERREVSAGGRWFRN